MGTCTRRRPSSSLPALHSLQFSSFVNLNNTVDLSVRMLVILSRELLLRIHIHSRNAQEASLLLRDSDLGAAVVRSINFDVSDPAFFETFPGQGAEILIYRVARAIVLVQVGFEIFAWSSGRGVRMYGRSCVWGLYRFSTSSKKS